MKKDPQIFRQKPLPIRAFQYTEALKKKLMNLKAYPNTTSLIPITDETLAGNDKIFFTRVFAYFDKRTQTMTYNTYGKTAKDTPLALSRWLVYEKNGEPTRLMLTDAEFQRQYEPV